MYIYYIHAHTSLNPLLFDNTFVQLDTKHGTHAPHATSLHHKMNILLLLKRRKRK